MAVLVRVLGVLALMCVFIGYVESKPQFGWIFCAFFCDDDYSYYDDDSTTDPVDSFFCDGCPTSRPRTTPQPTTLAPSVLAASTVPALKFNVPPGFNGMEVALSYANGGYSLNFVETPGPATPAPATTTAAPAATTAASAAAETTAAATTAAPAA